jgi:DNA-binding SARP family transcriptional activator
LKFKHDDFDAPLNGEDFAVIGRFSLLAGISSFPSGVEHALDVLRAGAEVDAVELFMLDAPGGELLLAACSSLDSQVFFSNERFIVGDGFPGLIAAGLPHAVTKNLARDKRYLRREVKEAGYHSCICVPVKRSNKMLGALVFTWKRPQADVARGLRLAKAVAPIIASAVLSANAEELGEYFDESQSQDRLLRRIAEAFCEEGGADGATICVSTPGKETSIISTEPTPLVCDQLADCGFTGCPNPNSISEGRGVVLRGDREKWPPSCRTLPASYVKFVEVPIETTTGADVLVVLGYQKEPSLPSTKQLACLRGLAKRVGPMLSRMTTSSGLELAEESRELGATDDAARLRIYCFGSFQVSLHGKILPRKAFVRGKAVELLKLLVMNRGRPLSRQRIVEELWPKKSLEAGSKNFHVTLHALRKTIEPEVSGRDWVHVRSQGEGYYFAYESSCWIDLERFTQLLNDVVRCEANEKNEKELERLLSSAIELYGDELFSGDVDRERWRPQRTALRRQYVDALVHLARLKANGGHGDLGVALVQQAVGAEPWRQDVQSILIETLCSVGRYQEARKHYDHVLALLDGPPSDELKALFRRIH